MRSSLTQLELQNGHKASVSEDSKSKDEDIFLHIAKSDSNRRHSLGPGRTELRRSRFGFSDHSLRSSTASAQEQSLEQSRFKQQNADNAFHSFDSSSPVAYSSLNSPSASVHPLEDQSHSHLFAPNSQRKSTLGITRSRLSRNSLESSPRSPDTGIERRSTAHDGRTHRQSAFSTVSCGRQPQNFAIADRTRLDFERARFDGTESTLSTTAPSTVWDELEDLKSRIRKLELTGKLSPPPHADPSYTSLERPRTATTTVTTLSSSPRQGRKGSLTAAETEAATSSDQVHSLLHSALAKAKDVVDSEVLNALEATVADALAISSLLVYNAPPSGDDSGYNSFERQTKRKADSLCRSLTELCLALSEQRLSNKRLSTRGAVPGPRQTKRADCEKVDTKLSYCRSASHEPESSHQLQNGSRLSSRLEMRRASLAGSAITSSHPKTITDSQPASLPAPSGSANRLRRLSSTLRARRLQTSEAESPSQRNSLSRSTSRATAEVGVVPPAPRISPRQRLSRDLVVSQPISNMKHTSAPNGSSSAQLSQPRTPSSPQTSIPLRRSHIGNSTYTPLASNLTIQPGSRRYGLSPSESPGTTAGPNSENTIADSSRRLTELSQTRIVPAPSRTFAASCTPINQSRIQTNSLGTRNFGFRQRPATTYVTETASSPFDDSID